MKKGMFVLFRFCVFAAFFGMMQLHAQSYAGPMPAQNFSEAPAAGVFIENSGQIYDGRGNFRSDVDFMTSSAGTNIYFTNHGIVYHFFKIEPSKYDLIRSKKIENPYTPQEWEQINKDIAEGKMDMDLVETRGKQYRIDIEFPGADLSRPKGEKTTGMKRNYFHPNYSEGIYGVSSYEQIRYTEVYPGIDLIFYFRNGQLKYDFELAPGADPAKIRILYKGHQDIKLDAEGNAVISILPGEIIEQAPVAFQDGKQVAAGFKLSGDTLLFETGDYDADLPLTIDPALRWSTWFYDNSTSAAFTYSRPQWDTNGNMFVLMDTYATAFPTVNPGGTAYYDFSAGDNGLQMVIMKFDPYRNLVWATYFCSSQSLATNFCNQGLVIDQNNEIYCVGHMFFVYGTPAAAFPTLIPGGAYSETTPGNNRNCILKFANNGTLIWSTVFCTSNPASSSGLDISGLAIDGSNRLVMAGDSYTPPSWTSMPVLNPGGSTYYNAAPAESATPTLHRFTTGLALQYSTYISRGVAGQYFNYGSCIAIDASNNIFMGNSGSGNITTANPGGAYIDGTGTSERKIILFKFLSSGALSWCTLYGGTNSANGIIWQDVRDVDIASNGDVVFVGRVNTTNFPTYSPGGSAFYKSTLSAGSTSVCDGVILKFSNTGVRLWATYIGGDGTSDGTDLLGVGIDENDNVYTSGNCRSTSFPTQALAGSYNQSSMTGSYAIILNMFNSSCVRQWGSYFGTGTWMPSGGFGVNNWVCDGVKLMQLGNAPSATPISTVDPGNGAYFQSTIEGTSCDFFAEFFYGTETSADATINAVAPICINASAFNLTAATAGGTWSGTGITNATNGTFNPATAGVGTHTITYSISGICGDTDTETITVNALPNVLVSVTDANICDGESTTISASGGTTYNWSHSLGTNSSYAVNPSSTTTYTVTGTSSGCSNTATITVNVTAKPTINASATVPTICNGASTTISATGGTTYDWSHSLGTFTSYIVSPTTTTTYTVTGTSSGCTNSAAVTVTVNPVPADPTAAGTPSQICLGESTDITASGSGSVDYEVYSAPTGGTYLGDATLTVTPSITTVYYVQAVNSFGCANTGGRVPVTIIVNPLPVQPSVSASDTTICAGQSVALLAGGSGSGVVYEVWNAATGGTNLGYAPMMVSPSTTTTYYIQAVTAAGCTPAGGRVAFTFTVNPVTDAAMNPAGPFCISDAASTLTAINAGGTWAGTGITNTANGTFDPTTAGVGTHQILYTTSGVCPDTDTMSVVVTNLLDATITPAGPFCLSDAAVNLSAATAGGAWSGNGITSTTNGTFDPATAGLGTHEIIFITSGSCGDADTVYISVVSQMNATITAAGPFCETEAGLVLVAADAGGTWSGTGILNAASGLFDPATAGPGTHEVKYIIPGSCGDADSINIVVYDSPDFTYVTTDESCTGADDGSIALTVTGGVNPITYTWSTGANTASVAGIGEGSYLVTVSDANGCERNAAITLGDPGVACDDIHPHAVVPNAFSPNADGENDVLYVRGEGVSQLSFIVYDRWGEKVFSTTSLNNGWDGTFRGKELDPAVFTYYLHAIFIDGTDKIEKGDITLTR